MEIKNKLTVTTGREGVRGERRRRVKSRNMCKGLMDKDKVGWGGLNVGGEWAGQGRKNGDTYT